jgi:glycosyltransferase involved in cell wall biosynthesis
MEKKNILYFSDARGVSGAEIVNLSLMERLDRNKFTPYVFCHANNLALIKKVSALKIKYQTSRSFPELKSVGITGIQFKKIAAYLKAFHKIHRELLPFIKDHDIHLIHANTYPAYLYCMSPGVRAKIPLICHVLNIRRIHWKNLFLYRLAGIISKRMVAVSEACKKNLLLAHIHPSKIVTIYTGIDQTKFKELKGESTIRKELGLQDNDRIIGLFGQPIPEKGHRYFIEAAAYVTQVFPDTKFLIVGYLFDSKYQKELNSMVKKLKLQDKVIFTGWRDDIPEIMSSLDVMAHARITPEPAALVLMEAMAMAKPVVATSTGGTPELIKEGVNGYLVPPKNSKAMAEAILSLLRDPEKAESMGKAGRLRFESHLTLDKHIQEIEKLYDETLLK